MPGLIATTLDAVLLSIQAQLISALAWAEETVLIVNPEKLTFHPHGDRYLCLWPDTESPDRPILEGAGRMDCRMTERLFVNVRTRLATDESTSSAQWLTNATLGHVRSARHPIWDALVDFIPLDSQGNQLVLAPIAPVNGGKPRLDADEKEWGESALAFEVKYQLLLTQNFQ